MPSKYKITWSEVLSNDLGPFPSLGHFKFPDGTRIRSEYILEGCYPEEFAVLLGTRVPYQHVHFARIPGHPEVLVAYKIAPVK